MVTSFLSFGVQAEVEAQVERALDRYLKSAVGQEAARRGWESFTLEQQLRLPANVDRFAACRRSLEVTPQRVQEAFAERQRFEVTCVEPQWRFYVATQVSVVMPAVQARTIIDRGQVLSMDDVALEPTNISRLRQGFYHRLEEVTGQAASRRIRAGQPLTPALIEEPPAVRRGQRVRIVATHHGIEASTLGEALGEGRVGDVIRVKNISSEQTIHAKIVGPGVVTSTF
ncbi:flagellar basal body P-ring formation chaperone FlgA [Alkalilimnicola ehrlichii]|uniref:flagellar basal body P-ring formation chaperone FlgA n=1 Tax=Alkalilimnicola ehrlichii TaxID=351052 RepID=UPI0015F25E24|nr:flagellar basal body P-ring formation chaperone FlgA [Alkalilimnicola ehrlichii]